MNTLKEIESFLDSKKFAFVGISGDSKKFSRNVFKELKKKGFEFYPVNPNVDEIDGIKCYHDISEVPDDVKHAIFMTPKSKTSGEVKKAIENGYDHIWIQQGANSEETEKLGNASDISFINNKCIMMFAQPVGSIHKFHRFFVKLFGKLPA